MGSRKVTWEDIPEEDREYIDPETYSEMLDRFPEHGDAFDASRKVAKQQADSPSK